MNTSQHDGYSGDAATASSSEDISVLAEEEVPADSTESSAGFGACLVESPYSPCPSDSVASTSTAASSEEGRPLKRALAPAQPSRTKRQRTEEQLEGAIVNVLWKCSEALEGIAEHYRTLEKPADESAAVGQWIACKLRMLPRKLRSEVIYKIQSIIYEAEMETFKDGNP